MAKKGKDGLTPNQRRYAQERAKGKTQRQAYAIAYGCEGSTDKTKDENACHLEKLAHVREKIEYLQSLADSGAIMSTEQRKAALWDIYQDETKPVSARLKALDMLNRMSGDYIDRKEVNATIQGLTREDRKQAMADALDALKASWGK